MASKRAEIRKEFFKEHFWWKDLEGRPRIEYVNWLENKLAQQTKPPTDLKSPSGIIELLDKYSHWLMEHGYTDTDWKDEEPFAIDEFLKDNPQQEEPTIDLNKIRGLMILPDAEGGKGEAIRAGIHNQAIRDVISVLPHK